ncbi:hypothetical protein MJ579_23985 [Klebsiella pneumoniae]|nr:hypothetical protein MJ579_23985 [Klebsiella pneumoniae]
MPVHRRKVVALPLNGGASLNLGNWRPWRRKANVTLLIMNDGYGVMRGIQDKYFGGRQCATSCTRQTLPCWRRRWVCRRGRGSG